MASNSKAKDMKRRVLLGGPVLAVLIIRSVTGVFADPFEDGMAAYNRGDYVPASAVFRALSEQGNAEAQVLLGVMYRRGRGSGAVRLAPICGSAAPPRAAMRGRKRNCARFRRA